MAQITLLAAVGWRCQLAAALAPCLERRMAGNRALLALIAVTACLKPAGCGYHVSMRLGLPQPDAWRGAPLLLYLHPNAGGSGVAVGRKDPLQLKRPPRQTPIGGRPSCQPPRPALLDRLDRTNMRLKASQKAYCDHDPRNTAKAKTI